MPLDDDYKEDLKSAFADIANVGGRWGGAVTAALFPQGIRRGNAVGPPGYRRHRLAGRSQALLAKGPTGVGVRTFVRLAMNWVD